MSFIKRINYTYILDPNFCSVIAVGDESIGTGYRRLEQAGPLNSEAIVKLSPARCARKLVLQIVFCVGESGIRLRPSCKHKAVLKRLVSPIFCPQAFSFSTQLVLRELVVTVA